jgi:hypothetical protein
MVDVADWRQTSCLAEAAKTEQIQRVGSGGVGDCQFGYRAVRPAQHARQDPRSAQPDTAEHGYSEEQADAYGSPTQPNLPSAGRFATPLRYQSCVV